MRSNIIRICIIFFVIFSQRALAQSLLAFAGNTGVEERNKHAHDVLFTVQDSLTSFNRKVLVFSVFNESIVPSFLNVLKAPVHPGISVGMQNLFSQRKNGYWLWTYNLAFYHHRLFQNGLFLNTELGYDHRFRSFYVQGFLGIGYLHTFFPGKVYRYVNGEYKKVNDSGKGHFMPSFALRPGYTLRGRNNKVIRLFLQYQLFLENPFSPENDISLLPHGAFHIGAAIPVHF